MPVHSCICTPILARRISDIVPAMQRAAPLADWFEVRLDYLEDLDFTNPLPVLNRILAERPRPVLLTLRPQEQGGAQPLSFAVRVQFWEQALQSQADLFDIEYDLMTRFQEKTISDQSLSQKILVSVHDFTGTPDNLSEFVAQHFPAQTYKLKLATHVRSTHDTLALVNLLQQLSFHQRQPIIIGMGAGGTLTRILGPSLGSLLTYSTAADGAPSAPGQFTAQELRDLFRIHTISSETRVAGIIGKPVGHSISPHIHNAAFAHRNQNCVYIPVEVQADGQDLEFFVRHFVHPATRQVPWNVLGYSVTIPHKLSVLPLVDRLTETAQAVGAVNTLIVQGHELIGDNTDAAGAMKPLERFTLQGSRVAVLGAGGAAYAVVYGLLQRGANVTVFARQPHKATPLIEKFGVPYEPFESFDGRNFEGLINTTPVGMKKREASEGSGFRVQGVAHQNSKFEIRKSSEILNFGESPVEATKLNGLGWVYDLIYTPRRTPLLLEAAAQGIPIIDGLEMLVAQAELQYRAWMNEPAPVEVMWEAAEKALAS